ncbi:unnamed protein product, partial [Iphiclides podalirius]
MEFLNTIPIHTDEASQEALRISAGVRWNHIWTNENVVKSPFRDIEIPNATYAEYVWKNLDKWATKTATVCGITGRQYTYEQIYKQSQVLGAVLRKKFRINNGDTVAIMLPNLPEYPTAILGVLSAGGLVTTLNPNYTAYEVQRQIHMSDAKLITVTADIVPTVKQALELCKMNIPIVVIYIESPLPEGTISFKEIIEDNHVDLGLPKGVELTNRNIIANVEQQNTEIKQYVDTTDSHQDNVLVSLPMFHSYGMTIVTLHKLSVGIKLVTLPRFKPETFINTLAKYHFHLFYFAPPTVLFLGSHPQVQTKHFEHLRCVTSGAAPLPIADIERFLEKVNANSHFCQAYGLTETAPLPTASPLGYKEYSKVGFGLPNVELRIIDENLKNRGPNECMARG